MLNNYEAGFSCLICLDELQRILLEDPRTLLDEVQYRRVEEIDERQTIAKETELLARHYFGCATIFLSESNEGAIS